MNTYLVTVLALSSVTRTRALKLDQIRLPSSQHTKYMPMGHDKPKVVPCPAPSQSSSGGGKTIVLLPSK